MKRSCLRRVMIINSLCSLVGHGRGCIALPISESLMTQSLRRSFVTRTKSVHGSGPSFEITGTLSTNGPRRGSYAEIKHTFSQDAVNNFAAICGDNNPLHLDQAFAAKTMFKGTIVHGILVSSLFSTLFGRSITGAVYVSQSLNFKRPVHVGVEVVARMEIIKIEEKRSGQLLSCSTTCKLSDGTLAVDGEAKVLLPNKTA